MNNSEAVPPFGFSRRSLEKYGSWVFPVRHSLTALKAAKPQNKHVMIAKLVAAISATILLFSVAVHAQQLADPHFDARVENPAYSKNFPRVLFDEAHYNLDTINNRYKPFADLVFNDGYQLAVNRQQFSKESLRSFKILIIANPLGSEDADDETASAPAFTSAEVDAIYDWVKDGGALLFIVNEGPFGSAAEILAAKLGVEISKSQESDHATGNVKSNVFSRENKMLAEHPITKGRSEKERVNRVMSFNKQSLKGPVGSEAFLRLAGSAVDQPGSPWSQGVAFRLDKGRVVVLGDSAMLSAQLTGSDKKPLGMNTPDVDNKQLTLNIMRWLSGWLK